MIRLLIFLAFLNLSAGLSAQIIQQDTTYIRVIKINDPIKRIDGLNRVIERMWMKGEFNRGLSFSKETQVLAQKEGYKRGYADALINEGIINDYRGKYADAISLYLKALKIQKKIDDRSGIAKNYINLGLVYQNQEDYEKALDYYYKSLAINKKLKDYNGISAAINNIGIIYLYQKNYDEALSNYFYCIEIDKKLKDDYALASTYNNIGQVYMDDGQYELARKYFLKSKEGRELTKDRFGICNSYLNLAQLTSKESNLKESKILYLKALDLAKELGILETIKIIYEGLTEISSQQKDPINELKYFQLAVAYKDSILNEESIQEQTQHEMQFEFDQKQADEKIIANKKALIAKQKSHLQKIILWSVGIVASVTLFFSWFLFKRWKIAQQQTKLIEEQKRIVEDKNLQVQLKNNEIMDSINCAKRIQTAILPSEKLFRQHLRDSFIYYEPKDIVAGDFYWMEAIGNFVVFAVADCTGHGVPGALVSVVCHNALNRSVREFGLKVPGEILDKTREIVLSEFEKSEDIVTDGMDISLCCFNTTTSELSWAGANNPLWIVRNSSKELEEIKGNKQPIGKFEKYHPFDTHHFSLKQGDRIYLFTDGYTDQFGGKDGKKFKTKKLKDLLLSLQEHTLAKQCTIIDSTLKNWKGEEEQVDDICIIGVQF